MQKDKRRFGDRSDGRKIRTIAPYDTVSPYIMGLRSDAQNYLMDKFDTDAVDQYVHLKRRSGLEKFGVMHVILAAYIRTISQKPRLNRFIAGQKIFARRKIEVNMAVKKKLRMDETNTVIKIRFNHTDTAEQVYLRFEEAMDKAFGSGENDFDGTARIINYIPGLLKKFTIWFLKLLDYFGLLPAFLLDVSPFHGSLFITSMGSLGIPPIFHHLYTFGNVPVFLAFGAKRYDNQLADNGAVIKRKYIDYTFVTDERICDGFYFASGLKLFRSYLADPAILDTPPLKVIEDIE
ncbi:MAG: hypothetical protein VB070_11465 [Clostridiaceae bacterium]|nr:hypothetical protein [Clostridiaceae bacterium]